MTDDHTFYVGDKTLRTTWAEQSPSVDIPGEITAVNTNRNGAKIYTFEGEDGNTVECAGYELKAVT
jgi:hypothetical protein